MRNSYPISDNYVSRVRSTLPSVLYIIKIHLNVDFLHVCLRSIFPYKQKLKQMKEWLRISISCIYGYFPFVDIVRHSASYSVFFKDALCLAIRRCKIPYLFIDTIQSCAMRLDAPNRYIRHETLDLGIQRRHASHIFSI